MIIKIYDASGGLVKEAKEVNKKPGSYSYIWDGKDSQGKELSNGSYFYTVEANNQILVNKATSVK